MPEQSKAQPADHETELANLRAELSELRAAAQTWHDYGPYGLSMGGQQSDYDRLGELLDKSRGKP